MNKWLTQSTAIHGVYSQLYVAVQRGQYIFLATHQVKLLKCKKVGVTIA